MEYKNKTKAYQIIGNPDFGFGGVVENNTTYNRIKEQETENLYNPTKTIDNKVSKTKEIKLEPVKLEQIIKGFSGI